MFGYRLPQDIQQTLEISDHPRGSLLISVWTDSITNVSVRSLSIYQSQHSSKLFRWPWWGVLPMRFSMGNTQPFLSVWWFHWFCILFHSHCAIIRWFHHPITKPLYHIVTTHYILTIYSHIKFTYKLTHFPIGINLSRSWLVVLPSHRAASLRLHISNAVSLMTAASLWQTRLFCGRRRKLWGPRKGHCLTTANGIVTMGVQTFHQQGLWLPATIIGIYGWICFSYKQGELRRTTTRTGLQNDTESNRLYPCFSWPKVKGRSARNHPSSLRICGEF